MARFQQQYREKVVPDLMQKFGYTSVMQVPRITKITLNMGVSEAVADKKVVENAAGDMTRIAGQKAVIAGVVGDKLSQADCIVTRSQKADWLKGSNFSPVTDTVLLYLNCFAKLATAGSPGNSLASPEGRAEKAAEDQKAAEAAQQSTAPSG